MSKYANFKILKKRMLSLSLVVSLLASSLTFSFGYTHAETLDEYDLTKADELVEFMRNIPSLDDITDSYVYNYDNDEEYNAYKLYRDEAIKNASQAINAYNSLSRTEKNNFNNIESTDGVDWSGVVSEVAALSEYNSYDMNSSAGLVMPGANLKDSYNYQFSGDCYYLTSMHRAKHYDGYSMKSDLMTTFLLIDTDEYNNSSNPWKPNTKVYNPDTSNYRVAYCCDNITYAIANHPYQMIDLEDSTYFEKSKANKIRSIVRRSYPFVSSDDMIDELIENNVLTKKRAQLLDDGQLVAATQMAIWHYANGYDFEYNYTSSLPEKTYFEIDLNPTIDYNLNVSGEKDGQNRTVVEANIEDVYQYLINLEPEVAKKKTIISDFDYEIFRVGDKTKAKIILNAEVGEQDNITITASERGTSKKVVLEAGAGSQFEIDISEFSQNKQIDVTISGEQTVPNGVYFYQPWADVANNKDERSSSQSFVGVSGGNTEVVVEGSFKYDLSNVNTEVLLEKYAKINGQDTDIPVEGAEFDLYKYDENTGASERISGFVTDENGRISAIVSDLKSGESLYFMETKAADGYVTGSDTEKVNLVSDDGGILSAKVYNSGSADLVINKVNRDKELIDGAKFELKIDDKVLGEYETGKNGDESGVLTIKGLIPGKYTLTEIAAPTGFNALDGAIKFTVAVVDGSSVISLEENCAFASIEDKVITIINLRPHETENVDKVNDVTVENVQPEQKDDLEKALEDYNKALDENGDKYTEDEKKVLSEEIDRLQEAVTSIKKVESVESLIEIIPSTITPEDKVVIEEALESFDELSEHEKSIVKTTLKTKLEEAVVILKGFEPEETPVVETTPGLEVTPSVEPTADVNATPSADGTPGASVTPSADTTPTISTDGSNESNEGNGGNDDNGDGNSSAGGDGSDIAYNNGNPQTGDMNIPLTWMILAFISLVALVVLSTFLIKK